MELPYTSPLNFPQSSGERELLNVSQVPKRAVGMAETAAPENLASGAEA